MEIIRIILIAVKIVCYSATWDVSWAILETKLWLVEWARHYYYRLFILVINFRIDEILLLVTILCELSSILFRNSFYTVLQKTEVMDWISNAQVFPYGIIKLVFLDNSLLTCLFQRDRETKNNKTVADIQSIRIYILTLPNLDSNFCRWNFLEKLIFAENNNLQSIRALKTWLSRD